MKSTLIGFIDWFDVLNDAQHADFFSFSSFSFILRYNQKFELEEKAHVSTRCMVAMPISFESDRIVNKHSASQRNMMIAVEEQDNVAIPPSFTPPKGFSHAQPMVGILEVLNKKIRSGHGLPEKELQMKASSALFGSSDVAILSMISKSLSVALTTVRSHQSTNAQVKFFFFFFFFFLLLFFSSSFFSRILFVAVPVCCLFSVETMLSLSMI